MVPSGSSTPVGGAQPVPSSLLRSNSGMLGGQGGPMPSQGAFPSLMPPRPHYNNVNMLGNMPNAPSILNQSYGNGIVNPGLLGSNGQRGRMDSGAEPDPLSGVGVPTKMVNAVSPSQVQGQQFPEHSGNQKLADQPQHEPYNFKHPGQPMQQFSAPLINQPQQLQSNHGGLGGMSQVKLEPQPSEHSILLHQQQQKQQQLLQLSRQSSQAASASQLNLLQQHRLLQLQQKQQQQQLLKTLPQQRAQMQQQVQAQNLPMQSPVKPLYEVGACARRLTQFMHQQQNRPEDNNIEFWRKFVAEFFAPNSKKKWCVSMYGSGRQTTGVFPQDVWHCEICNRKPGRGFEATFEVLPRLLKIKYESGTLEELLYVDMPREYHNPSGQIVLDYAKAIQESVFDQLRVVRDGQLRIVFSPDLKIYSWEFCARRHEELIPRKLLIPQVSQLGGAAQKYQTSTQNASSNSSVPDLQSNCDMFLSSAKQLVKCLEVPLVNDLGYTKRYVRCLQISEVVNSMKDLIDYSRISGTGPMESLAKFPRRANASSGFQTQNQSSENNEQASTSQATDMQLVTSNGLPSVNNTLNPSITSTSVSTISGHQNSMVSRPHNPMNSTSSPYAQTLPSPGSSNAMQPPPPSQSNPPPTVSNRSQLQPPSNNALSNSITTHMNRANSPANGDPTDSQRESSVQQIIQEMMLSGQGRMGDMKVVNGIHPSNNPGLNGPNCMTNSNPSFGFADTGSGMGQAAMLNGARTANGSNPMAMNGRVGMASVGRDQGVGYQDPSNQLLSGFGSVNGFDSFQFDWKPSP